jgi:hypothetical protein
MYKPFLIGKYIPRQVDKLRHAGLILEEVGSVLTNWFEFYQKPHCVEREFGTPEERESQERLVRISGECERFAESLKGLVENLESVRKVLEPVDWVVINGQRVSESDEGLHERLNAIARRFMLSEISREEYEDLSEAEVVVRS